MPSTRGPLPKRDVERAGHNAKAEHAEAVVEREPVAIPPPHHHWGQEVQDFYASFAISGQRRYFEPTDWQMLLVTMDQMQVLYDTPEPSAAMFKALSEALDKLMTTEASRRRNRIEVERPEQRQEDAQVSDILGRLRAVKDDG